MILIRLPHRLFPGLVLILAFALPAAAQYAIPWNSPEPGTVSSGGPYTLRGVAGQPDAFIQTGGSHLLSGGFLPGYYLCRVDINDLMFLTARWLETETTGLDAVAPVDLIDFDLLSTLWLSPCPGDWPVP